MKDSLLRSIGFYQKRISPLKRPCCRYVPTCSEYARQAVLRYGAAQGSILAAKRILKCHPFSPGGYDPVPERMDVVIRRDENK